MGESTYSAKAAFGIRLPVAGPLASPEAVMSVALAAESRGFDSVWLHDFIIWNRHLDRVHISCGSAEAVEAAGDYPPTFYESLSTLSFVAGLTSSIKLGIAVLCLPFRNPIIAAKQIATIDQLSEGRVILGVGTGAPKSVGNTDFEVLGISRATKYARTREYVGALKALWSGHDTYEGEFVSFEGATMFPLPAQRPHPPLWVGGAGPKALEMAAEFGQGWIPGRVSISEYPKQIQQIEANAKSQGRTLRDFTVAAEIYGCIAANDADAQAKAAKTIETVVSSGGFAKAEAQESFAAHALIGGPATVRDKVESYIAAGVKHFEIKFIYTTIDDLKEQIDLFASTVVDKVTS